MLLHRQEASFGNWLFRWRSYLPLVVVPLALPAVLRFSYPQDSHLYDLFWEIACLAVSLGGLLIRCLTVGFVPGGTSGRNTRKQIAHSLNTTGIYSVVRNPLYVGNFFMTSGVILFLRSFSLYSLFVVLFWMYYERIIMAEEKFLLEKFGDEYERYAERTPAVFPSFRRWNWPALSFSVKTVLRREYSSQFALILCFFTAEFVTDWICRRELTWDAFWLALLAISAFFYIALRTLKKKTRLLNVEGRF